eukprot:m.305241 g.305241  ORF g.305241 m.305241 type:complete len:332 (+) comp17633_c0_seq1:3-998(+)
MLEAELEVALRAVALACRVCEGVRTSLVAGGTVIKDDHSPVTVADYAAQAVVNRLLIDRFPVYGIVGEEDSGALREDSDLCDKVVAAVGQVDTMDKETVLKTIDAGGFEGGPEGRFWTLDPIDGTKGFLRNDQYAIALGLVENGRPVLGVLGCPNLPAEWGQPDGPRGCIFSGIVGEGCRAYRVDDLDHPTSIAATGNDDPTKGVVVESVESGHTAHDISSIIMQKLGVTSPSVRMDSQAKYGALSRGDGDIYLRLPRPGKVYEEKIWDHAAGAAVVVAAGGRVTDINGKDLDFSVGRTLKNNTGVIATNGRIHDAVLKAVAEAFSEASSK